MLSSFRSSSRQHAVRIPTDWRGVAIWLFVAGFLQTTVVHFIAFRGAVPSLIFLAVATYALRAGPAGALLIGGAGGLIEDALAGNTGAAWTISTALAAVFVSTSARVLFTDSPSIFAVLVAVVAMLREAVFWATLSLEGYQVGLGTHFVKIAVASALYTSLIALLVIWARWRFATR